MINFSVLREPDFSLGKSENSTKSFPENLPETVTHLSVPFPSSFQAPPRPNDSQVPPPPVQRGSGPGLKGSGPGLKETLDLLSNCADAPVPATVPEEVPIVICLGVCSPSAVLERDWGNKACKESKDTCIHCGGCAPPVSSHRVIGGTTSHAVVAAGLFA